MDIFNFQMASKLDESNSKNTVHEISIESNSEEDLIDLDKVLPLETDSNWLLESNNNTTDFHVSFNELHFSNPLIKNFIKSIYLNGKSKQILHHLLYLNDDRMTISCDNYAYICNSNSNRTNNKNSMLKSEQKSIKRHSLAVTSSNLIDHSFNNDSGGSLTDSLNSVESLHSGDIKNANHHSNNNNKTSDIMTQSSITDYKLTNCCAPKESDKVPTIKTRKTVASSQNILSRTYDKEDLEILKQTELSQSVFVPHISGSKIDHYSEIGLNPQQSRFNPQQGFTKPMESYKNSSLKRLFPNTTKTGDKTTGSKENSVKPRPNSMYQIDKLSKNTIDRCIKISQQKQIIFNSKSLLKRTENIFETDVLTPINSPRNVKNFNGNRQSYLKSPMIKSYHR